MNQKHELLVVESISQAALDGSRCEMFGDQICDCGYCWLTANTQFHDTAFLLKRRELSGSESTSYRATIRSRIMIVW
jgi:hypothetical protein